MFGDPGFLADVGKGSIAVVMEERTAQRLEDARDAVVVNVIFIDAAAQGFVELHKAADEEIETAIVVVVEPDGAGTPPGQHTRFLGDVGKRAVAVVVIENVATVRGDVDVRKTIAVVIANGYSHSIAIAGYAGLSVTSVKVPSRLLR